MSELKFSPGEFLGVVELNRYKKFLSQDGYKRNLIDDTYSFGIIRERNDSALLNFNVQAGTNPNTIKFVQDSYALDANGDMIYKVAEDNIDLSGLTSDTFYWVKISYIESPIEKGLFSIDASGNLTGTDSELIKILRGQPNFPSRIRFVGSSLNILSYDVVEVLSDTSAVLSGVFQSETGLKLIVEGTFTPGTVPDTDQKDIFQYDSCVLEFIDDATAIADVAAQLATGEPLPDTYFYIARVKYNGGVVTIQDKRSRFWQTRAEFKSSFIKKITNPLIGVEDVKWDSIYSTRDKNIVEVAFGMRTTNWTANSSLNQITVAGGNGGVFKDPSYFNTGDFNGWRIYAKDGSYAIITNSVKSFSQINLTLDVLDPNKYTTGDELIIVPDVDEVQIKCTADTDESESSFIDTELIDEVFTFPVNIGVAKMYLLVPHSPSYSYNIQYRYKKSGDYSQYLALPDDVVGYYAESSFDADGVLDPNPLNHLLKPYVGSLTGGYIELVLNTNAFKIRLDGIETGDVFGLNNTTLDNSLKNLQVTVSKQYQFFNGVVGFTNDNIINLKTANAKENNSFTIHLKQNITPGIYKLQIRQNYIDGASPGTLLKEFTPDELSFMKLTRTTGVIIKATFDASTNGWVLAQQTDVEELGIYHWFDGDLGLTNFDVTGKGVVGTKHEGYVLCNTVGNTNYSSLGVPNFSGRFIVGEGDIVENTITYPHAIGTVGGEVKHLLTELESGLVDHTHNVTFTQSNSGVSNNYLEATAPNDANGQVATSGVNGGGKSATNPHENRPPWYALAVKKRVAV